jgi:hypothetical protein
LFETQTVESLAATLRSFDPAAYDPAVLRGHAEQFSSAAFRAKLAAYVQNVLDW